jgi:hypothetical protein
MAKNSESIHTLVSLVVIVVKKMREDDGSVSGKLTRWSKAEAWEGACPYAVVLAIDAPV